MTSAAELVEDSKDDKQLLLQQLRKALEEYLADVDVATDPFLKHYVFADNAISLEALTHVPAIKALSSSKRMLRDAIDLSETLELDGTRDLVTKVVAPERSRLVLRDMPDDATEGEVRKIFESPECGRVTEIEKEHVTNTWFVTFATEEGCLKTHRFLQKNEFRSGGRLHSRVTERPPASASSPSRSSPAHPATEVYASAISGAESLLDPSAPTFRYSSGKTKTAADYVAEALAPKPGITFSPAKSGGGGVPDEDEFDYPNKSAIHHYESRTFLDVLKKLRDSEDLDLPWAFVAKDSRVVCEGLQKALLTIDPSEDKAPSDVDERGGGGYRRGRGGRGRGGYYRGGRGGGGYYRGGGYYEGGYDGGYDGGYYGGYGGYGGGGGGGRRYRSRSRSASRGRVDRSRSVSRRRQRRRRRRGGDEERRPASASRSVSRRRRSRSGSREGRAARLPQQQLRRKRRRQRGGRKEQQLEEDTDKEVSAKGRSKVKAKAKGRKRGGGRKDEDRSQSRSVSRSVSRTRRRRKRTGGRRRTDESPVADSGKDESRKQATDAGRRRRRRRRDRQRSDASGSSESRSGADSGERSEEPGRKPHYVRKSERVAPAADVSESRPKKKRSSRRRLVYRMKVPATE